jgi:hypothetical protein
VEDASQHAVSRSYEWLLAVLNHLSSKCLCVVVLFHWWVGVAVVPWRCMFNFDTAVAPHLPAAVFCSAISACCIHTVFSMTAVLYSLC